MDYLESVLAFMLAVWAFRTYLDLRQIKAIKLPKPPKYLAEKYTNEEYVAKQEYNLDKKSFGMLSNAFSTANTALQLLFGYLPWAWGTGMYLVRALDLPRNEITHTIAFFYIDGLLQTLISIPWSYVETFVIEQRHGFNKQTLRTFWTDILKQIMLGALLAPPVLAVLVFILAHAGPHIAMWLWGFALLLSLFFMTIYPIAIAPLFNKFTPLPEGELRDEIEHLAGGLSFPLTKLYVIDGSTRSAHSNAYMYGFFKNKRIVLYDTLVEQCSKEQVVAVLAHELGHWKMRHTPTLFMMGQMVLLAQLGLFTFVRNSSALFTSFGFTHYQPVFMSFQLFQLIIAPLDEVLGYLSNVVTRTFEFEADYFAVSLNYATTLKEALMVLDKENKSAINVDPLYSAYHYSHPPLVERLQAIDEAAVRVAARAKKYE